MGKPGDEAREEGRLTDQLSQLAKIFVLSFEPCTYVWMYIEGEAAVTLSDSTLSWDAEDSERATLKKYDTAIICM